MLATDRRVPSSGSFETYFEQPGLRQFSCRYAATDRMGGYPAVVMALAKAKYSAVAVCNSDADDSVIGQNLT